MTCKRCNDDGVVHECAETNGCHGELCNFCDGSGYIDCPECNP